MKHLLLYTGTIALVLQYLLIRAIVKQGRKNARKLYPPARLNIVYRKKLVEELSRKKVG